MSVPSNLHSNVLSILASISPSRRSRTTTGTPSFRTGIYWTCCQLGSCYPAFHFRLVNPQSKSKSYCLSFHQMRARQIRAHLRQHSSVITGLRLLWIALIFWFEIGVFAFSVSRCRWPDNLFRQVSWQSLSGTRKCFWPGDNLPFHFTSPQPFDCLTDGCLPRPTHPRNPLTSS